MLKVSITWLTTKTSMPLCARPQWTERGGNLKMHMPPWAETLYTIFLKSWGPNGPRFGCQWLRKGGATMFSLGLQDADWEPRGNRVSMCPHLGPQLARSWGLPWSLTGTILGPIGGSIGNHWGPQGLRNMVYDVFVTLHIFILFDHTDVIVDV